MQITFYQRKARPDGNFSIEAYFHDIRQHFPTEVKWCVAESRYYSKGLWKRLYTTLEAIFRQGEVNHVTGDVHFLALGLKKRKTILTIHDCGFMRHPNPLARWLLGWFWLKLPVLRSRIVTAVSEATKNDIICYTGCPSDKVRVIPTTIRSLYMPSPKDFNGNNPRVLLIGTAPNKNLERVIPAIEGIHCQLSIIGKLSGPQTQLLAKYQIDYQNAWSISDEAMLREYQLCDLLLFASTLEGFGMPILEAQSVERPVVTSNCSSMPEVAGEGACLVNPFSIKSIREGVLKVMADARYRDQLTAAGRDNRDRFRPEVVAQQYYALYKEIAASGSKAKARRHL